MMTFGEMPLISPEMVKNAIEKSKATKVFHTDFSVTKIPKKYYGVTFTTHANNITQQVKEFFTKGKLNGKKILVIQGPNGTGKTETVCAGLNFRVLEGMSGEYMSCKYTLCPALRSSRSFAAKQNEMEFFNHYYNIPFLVLDEAGKADNSELEKIFLANVISARYDNDLPLVIVTNMTMRELCDFLGKDIESRMRESASVLTLDGNDWRAA